MTYQTLINSDIALAVSYLKKGVPIAFPTETVYGLGASAFDKEGVKNIFKIKGRPEDNPLIVHIDSLEMLPLVAKDIPLDFYKLAQAFMPGPLTVVLKKNEQLPNEVSAGLDTIGVRIPSHPVAQALIHALKGPIAAPSANLSGKPSSTSAWHVMQDFEGKIPLILEGESSQIGIESTVLELKEDQAIILRPGAITKEAISKVLNKPVILKTMLKDAIPASPGMKYRHYAPNAPISIFDNAKSLERYLRGQKNKKRLCLSNEPFMGEDLVYHALSEKSFYDSLRWADKENIEEILLILTGIEDKEGLINRVLKASGAI